VSQPLANSIARSEFFLAPLLTFSSALLLLLPFAFHFLSGCYKNVGVNYGHSLEMANSSVIGIIGYFTTTFASKLATSE